MIQACYDRLPAQEREGRPLKLLEEAQSAYRPGRPVFAKVLQMASRGSVYGVVVVHPNRISRNHSDSGAFVQRLVDGQIECLDTTTGKRYTGEDSNDIFMLTLEGAMSWKDSRDKGDRILQAMRMRAGEGKHMSVLPVGYRTVFRPDGSKTLEVEPDKAGIIRRLFDLAATGVYSIEDLSAEAERQGLKNRSGKRLYKSSMHKLLTNPFFKGYVRFDGILARGVHEAIVPEDIWERVQRGLNGRRTDGAKPRDETLRDLFVLRGVVRCPGCGRALCAYRAKGRYVYYECKNPATECGVCVPQPGLLEQLRSFLEAVTLGPEDLVRLRDRLMQHHRSRNGDDVSSRRKLTEEHESIQKEIAEVFSERHEAAKLGIEDVVDQRLADLKGSRDELRGKLDALRDTGTAWVEKVIRSFELVKLLQEAILYGPGRPRTLSLMAIASNYSVEGRNLVLKLRSPFKECVQRGGRPVWWSSVDDLRTQVFDTVARLEEALFCYREAKNELLGFSRMG